MVIVDEAYADFSDEPSFLRTLDQYPNLIVLQTFSKAWGCAAIRLGMAFAAPEVIAIFNKIKYPYNVNLLTQQEAMKMMHSQYRVEEWVKSLLEERARLIDAFIELPCCQQIFSHGCQLLPHPRVGCQGYLRLLGGQGHHCAQPHECGAVS